MKTLLAELIPAGRRTLHVAPEAAVTPWLRSLSDDYVSVDLEAGKAMTVGDLTALAMPDGDRTLVFCSHVLEHVPDDRAAVAEIHRVLQPGGIAIVTVPIRQGRTDEGPVGSMEERVARFGQRDHVRFYGLDIVERLEAPGFAVRTLSADDLSEAERRRGALSYRTTNQVFVATRR